MSPGEEAIGDRTDEEAISLAPSLCILGVMVLIAAAVTAWSWQLCRGTRSATTAAGRPMPPPLEASGMDLGLIDHAHAARDRMQRQGSQLDRYGRIPGEPGMVHIPIEAAIRSWLEGEGR